MGVELVLDKDGRLKVHYCVCQLTSYLPEGHLWMYLLMPATAFLDQWGCSTVIHKALSNQASHVALVQSVGVRI